MKELIDFHHIFSQKLIILRFKLRSEKKDIIDFGMGNPDMPTPNHIRQKLKDTIDKPGVGRYSVSKGINGLRKAQAKYYKEDLVLISISIKKLL